MFSAIGGDESIQIFTQYHIAARKPATASIALSDARYHWLTAGKHSSIVSDPERTLQNLESLRDQDDIQTAIGDSEDKTEAENRTEAV